MENVSWKRIAATIGFVGLIVFFAYLIYALFFRSSTPTVNAPTNEPGVVGGLPTVGPGSPGVITAPGPGLQPGEASQVANGGLTQTDVLVSTSTSGAVADGNTLLYYQTSDGKFYRANLDGTAVALSDRVFHSVEAITWAPGRDKAVLEYPDGSNIVYNFATETQVTLPKHWQDFSFNPTGDELVFKSIGTDVSSRWLGVARANGESWEAIQALGNNGDRVAVDWSPNKQVVATYREASGTDGQEIYFVGLHGENYRSMSVPGIGFRSQWTPDGSRMVYSVASSVSNYKPALWIADATGDSIGQNRHYLAVNTWVDKCAFASDDKLLCAVPQTLEDGSGLAPDVANTTPDDLYQIDLTTGARQLLARPTLSFTAARVIVTSDGRAALVEDKNTGRVYKIAL